MNVTTYIQQQFSYLGQMTEVGAVKYAADYGFDATAEVTVDMAKSISVSVDEWVDKYLMRPTSVSEGGFSQSWSAEQVKNHATLMLKRYGITPNEDLLSLLGFSKITDVTNIW